MTGDVVPGWGDRPAPSCSWSDACGTRARPVAFCPAAKRVPGAGDARGCPNGHETWVPAPDPAQAPTVPRAPGSIWQSLPLRLAAGARLHAPMGRGGGQGLLLGLQQ